MTDQTNKSSRVVAIVSGGLDSVTMVYGLREVYDHVDMVSFNYGQRHRKELVYARGISQLLSLRHDIIDLSGLKELIDNSALTSPNDIVPDGHYAEDTMKQTVVPNRNMIMLSIAAGIAVNRNADALAVGVHAGDHFIYPDCRPRFIAAANAAIVLGNSGFGAIREQAENTVPDRFIEAPFLHSTKAEIALQALKLGVPLHMTWSCYKGGANHCGRCGTCVERLEAIDWALNELNSNDASGKLFEDHTFYEDTEFWKVQIHQAKENANG